MEVLKSECTNFEQLSQNPISFLNGDSESFSKFISIAAELYHLTKACSGHEKNDPFPKLLVEGFDVEQIWQQMDMFNNDISADIRLQVISCTNAHKLNLSTKEELFFNAASSEDLAESADSLMSEPNEEEDELEDVEEGEPEVLEKTEVDDKFFSLRQMEKFLDDQEKHTQDGLSDEIDYFNEILSTDGEEDNMSDLEGDIDQNLNDSDSEKEKVSARQLKYQDFFSGTQSEVLQSQHEPNLTAMSPYEKQQHKMIKSVENIEDKALAEPNWQLKGETTAAKRPVNSLLEEVLMFDQTERIAPEITDEHTHDLESIICQRIKDQAWDDVERKIKDTHSAHEFKKKVVLDSEQSKLSLQEIYEKEYLNKASGKTHEEKDNPAHTEVKGLMKNLFQKLDALSNFHFRAAQPEPEIKVVSNLPSIAMEEVQPVFHSDAQLLAPEEVRENKETKADDEKTSTDRKRDRRKKKSMQKVRAKSRSQKLQALAETNEKLKSLQAVHKLEQRAKLPGSQTTIIKSSKKGSGKLTSSKEFFSKLEQNKTNIGSKQRAG